MGIMTNRSSTGTGKLAFLLLVLTVLAGCQLGFSEDQGIEQLRKAAEDGHVEAQVRLGVKYDLGKGVPKNDSEAVKWYRKAAEQGHASAQFNLGVMYANGEGVPEDDQEAMRWYRKAAEQGNAPAQYNLGVKYAKGEGVPEDDRKAVKWFRLAAEQGGRYGATQLGRHVRQRRGGTGGLCKSLCLVQSCRCPRARGRRQGQGLAQGENDRRASGRGAETRRRAFQPHRILKIEVTARLPSTSDKNHYVNFTPTDNSFLFSDLMKTEASARPAQAPRPQDVGVGSASREGGTLPRLVPLSPGVRVANFCGGSIPGPADKRRRRCAVREPRRR